MRILLVENHQLFAETVRREFLASHDVAVAPSLDLARVLLSRQTYDVVLVDFDLDDGKGTDLVVELRAAGFRGRVIAVSSHQRGNDLLLKAGADACCPKMKFAEISKFLESQ